MTHLKFLGEIATYLIQQPLRSTKKRHHDDDIQLLPAKIPRLTHDWKRYEKKGYCMNCMKDRIKRPRRNDMDQGTQCLKRKALTEVDLNMTYT